jgi:transcriptional regulator with XRE-family HTH domain
MKTPANLIGPQIRRLRAARGWSQSKLAFKLQMSGLDVGREVVAQIETQTHCVKDKDIPFFALVLKVEVAELYVNGNNGKKSAAALIISLQAASEPKPPS